MHSFRPVLVLLLTLASNVSTYIILTPIAPNKIGGYVRRRSLASAVRSPSSNSRLSLAPDDPPPSAHPELYEINFRYGTRSALTYDASSDQFVTTADASPSLSRPDGLQAGPLSSLGWILKSSFLPDGVTPDYYKFIKWRLLQR